MQVPDWSGCWRRGVQLVDQGQRHPQMFPEPMLAAVFKGVSNHTGCARPMSMRWAGRRPHCRKSTRAAQGLPRVLPGGHSLGGAQCPLPLGRSGVHLPWRWFVSSFAFPRTPAALSLPPQQPWALSWAQDGWMETATRPGPPLQRATQGSVGDRAAPHGFPWSPACSPAGHIPPFPGFLLARAHKVPGKAGAGCRKLVRRGPPL